MRDDAQIKPSSRARPFVIFFSGSEGTTFFGDTLSRCKDVYIPAREPLEAHHVYNKGVSNATKLKWIYKVLEFGHAPDRSQWIEDLGSLIPDLPLNWEPTHLENARSVGFRIRPSAFSGPILPAGTDGLRGTLRRILGNEDPFVRILHRLDECRGGMVCFHRVNTLKRAVSNYRMVHERKSQFRRRDLSPSHISPQRLQEDMDRYQGYMGQYKRLVRMASRLKVPVLEVAYEDVLKDPVGTFQRFFELVGLPMDEGVRDIAASSRYQKSTNDDLRNVLVNYDEILDYFKGTASEAMLRDVGGDSV
jgi:hypothetical protein